MDFDFQADEDSKREADRLLAAAIYLMTCHARNHCPRLACIIERHLALLAGHGDSGDLVRDMARRLSAAWRVIRERDERLMAGSVHPAQEAGNLLH